MQTLAWALKSLLTVYLEVAVRVQLKRSPQRGKAAAVAITSCSVVSLETAHEILVLELNFSLNMSQSAQFWADFCNPCSCFNELSLVGQEMQWLPKYRRPLEENKSEQIH